MLWPPRTTAPSIERPRSRRAAAVLGGEAQYFLAQRFAGELGGAAGDDRAGAAIGAGVVAAIDRYRMRTMRISSDRRAEHGRGDLLMDRAGAIAELGGADGQADRCRRRARPRAASAKWPNGGTVSIMPSAIPWPTSQSSRRRWREAAAAADRVLDQIEALIEAVAAVLRRRGLPRGRSRSSDRRAARRCAREIRSGPCRSCRASSSIADSTAKLVCGKPVAAEGAGRHGVGIDRRRRRSSCWRSCRPRWHSPQA